MPDYLNKAEKSMGEVKNVKYQSFTRQLRDYQAIAEEGEYEFTLYIEETAAWSAPLAAAVEEYGWLVVFFL